MVKMDKRRRHGHRGCLKNVVLSQANIPALSRLMAYVTPFCRVRGCLNIHVNKARVLIADMIVPKSALVIGLQDRR